MSRQAEHGQAAPELGELAFQLAQLLCHRVIDEAALRYVYHNITVTVESDDSPAEHDPVAEYGEVPHLYNPRARFAFFDMHLRPK